MSNKITVNLVGEDGNVFNIIAKVSKALSRAGLKEQVEAFKIEAFQADSYAHVLQIVQNYVEVI